MEKLDEIIKKLNNGRKKIKSTPIDSEIKENIITELDNVIKEVHEIKSLNTVKTEIRNQIINPVKKEISKGNWIGILSILAGLASLVLSIYTLFRSPELIKESQEIAISKILEKNSNQSFKKLNSLTYQENDLYGLMNKKGEKVTGAVYEEISNAFDSFVMVKQFDYWGVITNKGVSKIPIEYLQIYPIHDTKYFRVRNKKGLNGISDANHQTIIKQKYRNINFWAEYDKVTFTNDGFRWGIMDLKENIIITPKYENIQIYSQDGFVYKKGASCGYSKISGEILFEIEADYIGIQNSQYGSYFTYQKNKKYGLLSSDGLKLTEPLFDNIFKNNNFYDAQMNGSKIRLNLQGQCLIGCENMK